MARTRAFIGWRPPKDLAEKVASPPYDVINSEEARVMAEGNPMSFLHVVKPEIDLDTSIDIHADIVYETAQNNIAAFKEKGYLKADEKPCLYAYRQIMGEHEQLGLVTCVAVDDYDEDKVKKHEKTRADKEDDRARHVDVTNANCGPVFLAYRQVAAIDEAMRQATGNAPDADFTASDGVRHTLWVIDDDATIKKLTALFADVPETYVADGHHRAKSGSRVRQARKEQNPNHTGDEEYNYFMAVLFPDNQLKILDYNRVVKDLNGLDKAQFLERVRERFEVESTDTPKPDAPHRFGMFLGGRWYRLKAKAGSFDEQDAVKSLDVSILQENLLSPILGIGDPRTDARIDFVGGIRGYQELEKRVNAGEAVAFQMYPTSMRDLFAVADAGKIMPPKSTWFEPKLRSGLVVHFFD